MALMHSPTLACLAAAMVAAQKELKNPSKDAKGQVRGRSDYRYLSLASLIDDTRDVLNKHGIALTQHPNGDGNVARVTTMLLHESGEWLCSDAACGLMDANPQNLGSVISYLRRYAWQSVIGVCAEDDDDAQGVAATVPPRQATSQAVSAKPTGPAPVPAKMSPTTPTNRIAGELGDGFIDSGIKAYKQKAAAGKSHGVLLTATESWLNTWDDAVFLAAKQAKTTGEIVRVHTRQKGNYTNVVGLGPVPVDMIDTDDVPPFDAPPPESYSPDDPLPF